MNEESRVFVQYQPESAQPDQQAPAWLNGVDGLVINPCHCSPQHVSDLAVKAALLMGGDPERDTEWREIGNGCWICDQGLEETARLRDQWPDLQWVPRLSVFKPVVSYRFSGPAIGEGFSFYTLDTAAIQGWRVTAGDCRLADAIARAVELGFTSLWLHSDAAESRGKGLELEILDRIRGSAPAIWISGGVSELKYLRNLARMGGASAVVVDQGLLREFGMESLRQALIPRLPLRQVPIRVESGNTPAGAV